MAQDHFQYEKMIESALRGVVREALTRVSHDGLRGDHHFYISFRTGASGVVLPPQLLAKYPEVMTFVLQHQFWGLEVGEHAFSVNLSFSNRMERLTIPFAAVTTFADPSVNFGLQFQVPAPESAAGPAAATPVALPDDQASRDKPADEKEASVRQEAEIVTLDRFRKR